MLMCNIRELELGPAGEWYEYHRHSHCVGGNRVPQFWYQYSDKHTEPEHNAWDKSRLKKDYYVPSHLFLAAKAAL